MTIIVASASERIMAADTAIVDTDRNLILGYASKIIKSPDGVLAGASGACDSAGALLDWVMRGMPGKPYRKWFKDASLLLMFPDETIWTFEESIFADVCSSGFAVIGHGGSFALAAHSIGATALDCVRAACNVSCYCGGEPTSLKLGE